ncbi:2-succinyl-5-enolpyruvyl-6-hydroxy-3-cyclohexene-1-carboxylic-acid synthase [Geitlerinema splendidum]|nr:2-succinyl-5-enolpyruvyl-6-hydroxy-3-cyclohexene-1-carboxylic-acid synthase [Geitlerinema splendidum]
MIDFRNTNTVWASILAETLHRLGLQTAIICPGSRSTALTVAFAQHREIEAISILDERSAAFFALGVAKRTGLPVVLVCTSGTAGANFYPAVIEAKESRIPLLILTADRPPEMRECHSGQTIDQVKLYGTYPNWQVELAVPALEMGMLGYLRQTVMQAWERSRFPTPGPVHLNLPFRDPLAPIPQAEAIALEAEFPTDLFFSGVKSPTVQTPIPHIPLAEWQSCPNGLIIAGTAQPGDPETYCRAIAHLAQALGWPVLADGLSPIRNYAHLNPNLIATYDILLRNANLANSLIPDRIIQIGELPTSKELRNWLTRFEVPVEIIEPSPHNVDPLHRLSIHHRFGIESLLELDFPASVKSEYCQRWQKCDREIQQTLNPELSNLDNLFEGKVAWLLPQILPQSTPIFIANSMPVRDVEFFWMPNSSKIQPFFNRGANGIDGTLSTALGIAHNHQSSIMLTGDLALLHDTNGFLFQNKLIGHLTIILINNHGGGIFENLPISQFNPPFEEFFATPQKVNFTQLCAAYNISYELIQSWQQLHQRLHVLPKHGIRLLEIPTNRKADAKWRQEILGNLANKFRL